MVEETVGVCDVKVRECERVRESEQCIYVLGERKVKWSGWKVELMFGWVDD